MNTLKKINKRARRAGFSVKEILIGYAIVLSLLFTAVFTAGSFLIDFVSEAHASNEEAQVITLEKAENVAVNFANQYVGEQAYKVIDAYEKVEGKFIVELRYDNGNISHSKTDFVIVTETGNSDKPVKRSFIAKEDIEKIR